MDHRQYLGLNERCRGIRNFSVFVRTAGPLHVHNRAVGFGGSSVGDGATGFGVEQDPMSLQTHLDGLARGT